MSTARPRPRPRPVAKPKAASSTTVDLNSTPSPGKPSSSTSTTQNPVAGSKLDDEDAIFLRNRGRTSQCWNKLRAMTKDTPSDKADEDDLDWGEQTEPESTPRHRKKKSNKQHELPRWQTVDIVTLLSSDNEEDDFEITEHTPRISCNDSPPRKRKRDRSRSKSITPPPQLPIHQLNNARALVRQALAVAPRRAPSPIEIPDDPTDTSDLNPELAKIAEEVRRRAVTTKNTPEQGGGPELVIIKVRWQPHPLNTAGAKDVWNFKMKRHDTFQYLFEELADLAAVLVDHLVVSHDGKRLFASGTPHSLRIWAEGELEACDQTTWDHVRAQRHQQAPKAAQSSKNSPSPERESDSESEAESTGGDKIKLVFRSAATEENVNLTVRPTTTCGVIVKAFLKAAGLSDQYPQTAQAMPQLMVDGDKMADDMEIGEADLDDGDLVEVVGL
ncbi:uncharacterized protein F5891DRAFT_1002779 [Suillus fuscotomentosus]|uniref:Rad60/SUMO-like domain-containing protein n=1 Tax=Suillus fuscotomentosus TaxID=1912939 RepID=A0AAD4HQN3_9AGAM|nr:uncharacterized protein F5891DRAFT_1002779 [Suillus fuscotomentosus]KAG1906540.1 hypothetical protein F5891DRAFT_1002779 [Suillus fuscotomentosus]